MAFPSSPGVVVNEIDLTAFVPGVSTSVGAFAGVFRWGPVGERVLLDSEQQLVDRFGKPTNFNPETFFTAANFLSYSNALQVVRAANTTGTSPIMSSAVTAGNSTVTVANTSELSNGMIVVAESADGTVRLGSSISVINTTAFSLSLAVDALSANAAVDLQFVSNTTAFNAIVNTAAVANLTGQIVKTEDEFLIKDENDDFDNDVQFIAKWPGALGNSLKISMIDTAEAYQSNTDLTDGGLVDGGLTFTVDSNNAVIGFGVFDDATSWNVNNFNTFVANTMAKLSVGDYIMAGNVEIGEQAVQIASIPDLDTIDLGANAAATVDATSGSDQLVTTSNGFTTAGIVNGQWIAIFSNSTVYHTAKVLTVDDGNTVTLATNATFTNTAASFAPLSNTVTGGYITLVDRYKRAQDNVRLDLVRYWEYADTFDQAPGQSTTVLVSGNTAANDEVHLVVVDEDGKFSGVPGTILEKFERLSRATDGKTEDNEDNYFKTVLNNGSKYIWAVNDRSGAVSANATHVADSTNLTPQSQSFTLGQDGSDESTLSLGVITNAYDQFASTDDVDISLIMTGKSRGGVAGGQLANYLIDNIAEPRMDSVVFVSPEKNDVINNVGREAVDIVAFRNTLRSTSYGFLDSGYKYMYDRYNDVYRYVPLNGDIAGLAARTEQTNDAWWSIAGFNRGKIKNVVRLAYNPRKTDRDLLYKNSVNSVVTFPGDGTLLYGDKTLLAKPSAFDRINVRRLFIVLEKSISRASKYSLFEFNDAFTRAQFRNLVIPFLRDVQGRRGIKEFIVVCDSTNNPASVIDRNEFVGDIYIKPARSINFITLNFYATPTGISFSEIIN